MIELRNYEPQDYHLAASWWAGHGVTATPQECVPKLGVIALVGGVETFAAWVSMDNSCGLCFLLWPVSNPEAPARAVAACVEPVIGCLMATAKSLGYHTMLGITHADSLVRKLRGIGFSSDTRLIRLNSIHL